MKAAGEPTSRKQKRRWKSVPPFPLEFRLKIANFYEEEG